eukprot:CAMPEP_0181105778 /NCGR_PEP_ID=MMETSP1071-20121207/16172_1 /TAXON_ID=35127 /ORGANISM="Thalassiosira sp., Strain NH16" /LENGTH=64 /DNA_ID=CAMNT_0023189125 /DNA_START=167 /DNA_END=358 /DNA_ORIENTATION=+
MRDLIDDTTPKLLQNSAIEHAEPTTRLVKDDLLPIVAVETDAVTGVVTDNIVKPVAKPMRAQSL